MIELNSFKKNKINLSDYNYERDLENRVLSCSFDETDIAVLEEILYSPLKVSLKKIIKNLDLDDEDVLYALKKIQPTELFSFDGDSIIVDKDIRKYFENHLIKYDPQFQPGMEFLQTLLRKVSIDVLPLWYGITKSSNSIFDCLVEKYLFTPNIFNNYSKEVHFDDPLTHQILDDLFSHPDLKLYVDDLVSKYQMDRKVLEKHFIDLEFHFFACLTYEKEGCNWRALLTPFQEWKEYLLFLKSTSPQTIQNPSEIKIAREGDFPFIEDLILLLSCAKKSAISLATLRSPGFLQKDPLLHLLASEMGYLHDEKGFQDYLLHLVTKLSLVKLGDVIDSKLYALEGAHDWLELSPERKAHALYRHPLNRCLSPNLPYHLWTEKNVREIEKSLSRVAYSEWIYVDDFINNLIAPVGEQDPIHLKKIGKTWKYALPAYTDEEKYFIKIVLQEWLFEPGVVAIGVHLGRPCFRVTPFGQSLFL